MISLTSPKARTRLEPRGKPYFVATVTPGVSLGYRKLADRAGTWSARIADGQGGNRLQALGTADDLEPANGREVLTYAQASDAARKVTRSEPEGRLTLAKALADYAGSNADRLPGNVSRVTYWLDRVAPALLTRDVATLTAPELSRFRDGIEGKPATVNRTVRILKAALTGAADRYPDQVANGQAWRIGLKQKPHSHDANNVVLTDDQVRDLVAAAYDVDPAFGLFTEVGAQTGARPSQLVRLEVRDLQLEPLPRLMMPTSKKGTGSKPRHIAVPISASLAAKLRQQATGAAPSDPLLRRNDGLAWCATSSDHRRPFELAVEAAGLATHAKRVTFYALRHSSIVRRIKANRTPLRTIAAIHDTSVVMIERNYSRDIDQYDDSARAGLLDLDVSVRNPTNVVPFAS